MNLVNTLLGFATDNLPSVRALALGGPPALLWALASLALAAHLKRRRAWPTGYTRKVFHVLIFATVALVQHRWGLPGVCLFGLATSAVVFAAVWLGDGHPLYEAVAREKDAPHRTYFILAPYAATLVGGLAASLLFGRAALAGFLVTGLGDAVGEPVGTRFGRHPYRVPTAFGVPSTRTWEGSAAVFAACTVALLLAVPGIPDCRPAGLAWLWIPAIALLSAAVEAVSPHGWDNALLQVIPTALVSVTLQNGGLP